VDAHLRRVGSQLGIDDGDRRLLRLRAGAPSPSVDILIPSSLRHRHAVACISEILRGTDYPGMSVRVGIGQARPLGPEQREAAATLEALGARVLPLQMTSFNFSAVINRLAALGSSEYVLLLNDDVTPMAADWLSWMVACMDDRRIAGAGARLLYPGGTVQHGGVLMGLGGLCEHAHRGLDGNDPGYAGRAVLTQELSAVLGIPAVDACTKPQHPTRTASHSRSDAQRRSRYSERSWPRAGPLGLPLHRAFIRIRTESDR
jgi:hypothetical protein